MMSWCLQNMFPHMVSPWIRYGFLMAIRWFPMRCLWIPYGFVMSFLCFAFWFFMICICFQKVSHGFSMVWYGLAMLSRWPPGGSWWLAFGFRISSSRCSYGPPFNFTWVSYVSRRFPMTSLRGFLWLGYGFPTAIRWFSMVCPWFPGGFRIW